MILGLTARLAAQKQYGSRRPTRYLYVQIVGQVYKKAPDGHRFFPLISTLHKASPELNCPPVVEFPIVTIVQINDQSGLVPLSPDLTPPRFALTSPRLSHYAAPTAPTSNGCFQG